MQIGPRPVCPRCHSDPRDYRISDDVPSPISEGSIGIARLVRTQSRATFLAIVSHPCIKRASLRVEHHTTSPCPFKCNLHNILGCIQNHRRSEMRSKTVAAQKCCTNSPAHSGLPAQKPSRRSLSDSLFCVINTPPSFRHSRLPSMRTTWRPPRSHSASESETQPTPVQVASSPSKVVAYCCATEREVHLSPRREDPPRSTTTSLLLVRRIE